MRTSKAAICVFSLASTRRSTISGERRGCRALACALWGARIAVPSGVGHDDIEFIFEHARHRRPAGASADQSVEQNDRMLGAAGA